MKTAKPTFAELATITDIERFATHFTVGDCWNWHASKINNYGAFGFRGRVVGGHRFIYELIKGRIPAGWVIDHLCRNKACVNPNHLEAVTQSINVRRAVRVRDICKYGHSLTPDNVFVLLNSRGMPARRCLACKKASRKLQYQIHKAAKMARKETQHAV
jgi:hypothetical protein